MDCCKEIIYYNWLSLNTYYNKLLKYLLHYYITIAFVFKLFMPKGAILNLQWCKCI